jgi:hypothetical protein
MKLSKHKIKIVGILPTKVSIFLWPVEDGLALEAPGIYIIC